MQLFQKKKQHKIIILKSHRSCKSTLNIIIFSFSKYVFAINQQSTSIRLSEWTLENCKNNFMFAQD